MANTFITLNGKYYYVKGKTWQPGGEQPAVVRDTLTGKTVKNFGAYKLKWSFTALVYNSSAPAGFGVLSDMQAVFLTNTSAGNVIAFNDYALAGPWNVVVVNSKDYLPKPTTPLYLDPGALWEVVVQLRQAP